MSRSVILSTARLATGEPAPGALSVVFERLADRYAHHIAWQTPAGPLVLVESVEGTDTDIWPPSPPLQDIHLEDRPGGIQLALLVGKAGRSHWSLSCEVAPQGTITFDFACRVHERPSQWGSTYRVVTPKTVLGPSCRSAWQIGQMICALQADLAIEFNDDSQIALSAPAITNSLPTTLQWKYAFRT